MSPSGHRVWVMARVDIRVRSRARIKIGFSVSVRVVVRAGV